jgi:hypothetical protein
MSLYGQKALYFSAEGMILKQEYHLPKSLVVSSPYDYIIP